ncbi:copper amine oxidase N-terminal domain-containing protein [Paenibacillus sp. S150]|uniref:copper amine oxidase N-terminal domain-containing protein n=1 Tax=Paenibacillus sp. S150 TaxID=2749826 RepID=UPI001C5890BC|nr:copper amine oxidase N-terminal domain-containing protein [Paenibacillus sp. S150]MBW4084388.1 hypothetical protein [Paenibacillus sp. S150]
MNKKWMIAAIAAGMTITGSAGVYAGAKLEQIKAYLNHSIGVVVDGTPYWLKDGNGKTLTPITYEGLTYLPIRSIAGALKVPITYDAASYKVRIGSGAETGGAPGTGGGSAATPVESTVRPVNLPQDFPIPEDAVIATTLDTAADGVKKAAFTYSTQESLETMGFVYSEYVRIKRLDNASQTVSATTVKITGRLGGTSPVSITGKASTARPGFNIFTITFSES